MHCHPMVYLRIVLTTLVIITCLIGDNFVELTQHPLLKALVDNATHAVIGALSGIAFVIQFYDRISNCLGWILIFVCFSASALIDADHFIQARSWNLEDATGLLTRPFLHCTTIPLMLFILFLMTSSLNFFKSSLFLGVLVIAFVTHHSRDALRRGYWLCPMGNTRHIGQIFYIFLTVMTPYCIFHTQTFCRSFAAQKYFGFPAKIHDRQDSKAGYRYSIV